MTVIIFQDVVLLLLEIIVELSRVFIDLVFEPVVVNISVPIGLNSHRHVQFSLPALYYVIELLLCLILGQPREELIFNHLLLLTSLLILWVTHVIHLILEHLLL